MKAGHLIIQSERREHLEACLDNAEHMLKMEREISTEGGWSEQRKTAALLVIPKWEHRISELKATLKR